MANKHLSHDLAQMQSLPLQAKIRMSEERILTWFQSWTRFEIHNQATDKTRFATIDTREFGAEPSLKENERIISAVDGQVYVSFSGGKDSTVLADLCARVCEKYGWTLYLLFVNTGLEYPEIQKFVKTFAEWLRNTYKIEVVLDVVRPEMRFDEVIKKYGYPVLSKETAHNIYYGRKAEDRGDSLLVEKYVEGLKFNRKTGEKYYFKAMSKTAKALFKERSIPVSDYCCDSMKKKPAKQYAKKTGRKSIQGTMASESKLRYQKWLQTGCNAFNTTEPTSRPLSFWTSQDILHYIKEFNVPYCSVYGDIVVDDDSEYAIDGQITAFDVLEDYETTNLKTTGCDRTGCIFCMFGCHLEKEPNRFQRLKETHPRQYEYCINGGEYVCQAFKKDENNKWQETDVAWEHDDGTPMTQEEIEEFAHENSVGFDGTPEDEMYFKIEKRWQPNKEGLGLGKVLDYIGVKYE